MTRNLIATLTAVLLSCLPADAAGLFDAPHVGFTAGVGGELSTGSLHDNFGHEFLFAGGLTGGWQRWRLKAELTYSQPAFRRANLYDVRDEQGRDLQLNTTASPGHLRVGVLLGYTLWQGGRCAVTPLAGMAWNRYKWEVNNIKWSTNDRGEEVFGITDTEDTRQSSVSWMAAVDVDVRLHSHLIPDDKGHVRRYTSLLRVSPFVAGVRQRTTVPAAKGVLVGLTVSYCGLLSFIR